ncbi:MAG: alpha/beta hydrolase [Erysipelotrichaceae bacterium]|nr:alpha/beta hydrolase [Erysipelotrichaceae bacterium]
MLIKGINSNIRVTGSGKDVILLHGWGQNMIMMKFIEDYLSSGFRVINLDLPGFGESEEPKEPWGVQDYTDWMIELFKELKVENPIIIGHSFGCRMAIHYASEYPVYKMILTGAAGIREKQSSLEKFKISGFKAAKKLLDSLGLQEVEESMKKLVGSSDYRNVSGIMRETFVKCVNDDVTPILPLVKCPVLLVFGSNDTATPLWMAQQMEKMMVDAGLAVFEGDDHYAYYHQWQRFNGVLEAFIGGDRS